MSRSQNSFLSNDESILPSIGEILGNLPLTLVVAVFGVPLSMHSAARWSFMSRHIT